jgi:hypothetical protein
MRDGDRSAHTWWQASFQNVFGDAIAAPLRDWSGTALIAEGERYEPGRKTFIYGNNRLEGNALGTISTMLEHSGMPDHRRA